MAHVSINVRNSNDNSTCLQLHLYISYRDIATWLPSEHCEKQNKQKSSYIREIFYMVYHLFSTVYCDYTHFVSHNNRYWSCIYLKKGESIA